MEKLIHKLIHLVEEVHTLVEKTNKTADDAEKFVKKAGGFWKLYTKAVLVLAGIIVVVELILIWGEKLAELIFRL
jgi:hypothetical protein